MLELPQKTFAKHLSISQSTLSQIENGYYLPSYEALSRAAQTFDIDCNWVILGRGEPFYAPPDGLAPADDPEPPILAIHEKALAGYSSNHRDERWLSSHEQYRLPGFGGKRERRLFQILGDSMEPTVHDQDFVVAALSGSPFAGLAGRAVVVVTTEELLLKRLTSAVPGNPLVLASDNPRYETIEVDPEDALEVWEVLGRLTRRLTPAYGEQDFRLEQLEAAYQELSRKLESLSLGGSASPS